MSVLLVFIDGIGLGTQGAHNPFDGGAKSILRPLGNFQDKVPHPWHLNSLDAHLGISGLPQSASGTSSILTGINVPKAIGEHLWAFPDGRIRAIIEEHSILKRLRTRGKAAKYLNGFTKEHAQPNAKVHRAACTCAALAGNGTLCTMDDVLANQAATFDLTHEVIRTYGLDIPLRTMAQAAQAIANGTHLVDFALFELFLTDKAGHKQDITWARHEIARTEQLLEALTLTLDPQKDTLFATSDHGNLEDLSTRGHTDARVPVLAWGQYANVIYQWKDLTDVGNGIFSLCTQP